MIKRANEEGTTVAVPVPISMRMKRTPRRWGSPGHPPPRATEHMEQIIAFIKGLRKRYAYAVDGDVYFDTAVSGTSPGAGPQPIGERC